MRLDLDHFDSDVFLRDGVGGHVHHPHRALAQLPANDILAHMLLLSSEGIDQHVRSGTVQMALKYEAMERKKQKEKEKGNEKGKRKKKREVEKRTLMSLE